MDEWLEANVLSKQNEFNILNVNFLLSDVLFLATPSSYVDIGDLNVLKKCNWL